MSSTLLTVVFLFLGCLAAPFSTPAQTELAGVYRRVTDQSGAVIVDAEVEIKNVETNQSVTVKTNQNGLYTIPSLHPGHYLISARKPGFKTVTVTQLDLNVQDNVVRNFALQVTFSGPVVKDRTFFFFSYEDYGCSSHKPLLPKSQT